MALFLFRVRNIITRFHASIISFLRTIFAINKHTHIYTIDIKKVDKQLTHTMHVKDRHVNDTFINKLTKWYQ